MTNKYTEVRVSLSQLFETIYLGKYYSLVRMAIRVRMLGLCRVNSCVFDYMNQH